MTAGRFPSRITNQSARPDLNREPHSTSAWANQDVLATAAPQWPKRPQIGPYPQVSAVARRRPIWLARAISAPLSLPPFRSSGARGRKFESCRARLSWGCCASQVASRSASSSEPGRPILPSCRRTRSTPGSATSGPLAARPLAPCGGVSGKVGRRIRLDRRGCPHLVCHCLPHWMADPLEKELTRVQAPG